MKINLFYEKVFFFADIMSTAFVSTELTTWMCVKHSVYRLINLRLAYLYAFYVM
jgi:hypothetical protein